MSDVNDGISLIAAERKRQVQKEGWTPEHDDEHTDHSLVYAAICYAHPTISNDRIASILWPRSWSNAHWKPKDRIRNLVRAGALIAAEIDRLQRREKKGDIWPDFSKESE